MGAVRKVPQAPELTPRTAAASALNLDFHKSLGSNISARAPDWRRDDKT